MQKKRTCKWMVALSFVFAILFLTGCSFLDLDGFPFGSRLDSGGSSFESSKKDENEKESARVSRDNVFGVWHTADERGPHTLIISEGIDTSAPVAIMLKDHETMALDYHSEASDSISFYFENKKNVLTFEYSGQNLVMEVNTKEHKNDPDSFMKFTYSRKKLPLTKGASSLEELKTILYDRSFTKEQANCFGLYGLLGLTDFETEHIAGLMDEGIDYLLDRFEEDPNEFDLINEDIRIKIDQFEEFSLERFCDLMIDEDESEMNSFLKKEGRGNYLLVKYLTKFEKDRLEGVWTASGYLMYSDRESDYFCVDPEEKKEGSCDRGFYVMKMDGRYFIISNLYEF